MKGEINSAQYNFITVKHYKFHTSWYNVQTLIVEFCKWNIGRYIIIEVLLNIIN